MLKNLCILALAGLTLVACKDEKSRAEADQERIENYLDENNLTAERHPSGLYYIIDEPGMGGSPTVADSVEVMYRGTLLDGLIFDQTPGDTTTITFLLADLIECWQIGIPLVEKGGEIRLISPTELAYAGLPTPLAEEILIFDITLVDWR